MWSLVRLALALLAVSPLWAQAPVTWSATAEPSPAHPGEVVTLNLTATIAAPYHIYAAAQREGGMVATSFAAASGLEALGGLREDQPDQHFDEGFQVMVLSHQGTVTFRQPLRVAADAAAGELEVGGAVEWQACTETSCLPPDSFAVSVPLTIAAGPVREEFREPPAETPWTTTAGPDPPGNGGSAADQARAHGLWAFLLVAFLAGFAALLTPCVFPMVPITVSFFTKQAGENSRQRVGLATAYGTGIVVMYTALGLILAVTLGASGAQRLAASPVMNLLFAGLFVFFALSLFGMFELSLPSGLVNFTSRQGNVGGYLGALFMGLTLTLAAFTCTVQFVGGVLVWASNGEFLWPILGMLAFSSAFALPFVLLALFPQYLASLPRSGGWLESTKIVLGWIEVGAAFKFLSNADLVWQWRVLTRELVLAVWAGCAVLIVLFLAGVLNQGHGPAPERIGRGRQWTGLMFAVLAGYFGWGLTGAKLDATTEALLPPPNYGRGAQQGDARWIEDLDAALASAREQRRNVFIDFTGVTCTNCRWMEQNVFPDPRIRERLDRLVRARLYTDTGPRAQDYRKLQIDRYQTASLPFYAIVDPAGETIATFDGLTRKIDEFAAFLDRGG